MRTPDFLRSAQLDAASLDAWLAAGWLAPRHDAAPPQFSDVDVARAWLVHDLRRMGVNDDGISVILDLLDQLHGLRRVLRAVLVMAADQSDGANENAAGSDRRPDADASDGRTGSAKPTMTGA